MLCQYCDKEYIGNRNLMVHIKRVHKVQDEGSENVSATNEGFNEFQGQEEQVKLFHIWGRS